MTLTLRSGVSLVAAGLLVGCGPHAKSAPEMTPQGAATKAATDETSSKTLAQLFEGKFPGVAVAAVGSGVRLVIRNAQNIDGSPGYPLYLVDGNPVAAPDGVFTMSPNDIAKIEVLKDDASTLIWGERAANGVVKITTKRK